MNRIYELRRMNKLSQAELADKLNLHQMTVSRYEKGERKLPPDVIAQLCEIFDCSSDYLLGLSDENIKKSAAQTGSGPVSIPDEFMRLQEANELFLKLDDAGKAQATAYLRFLAEQQGK